MSKSIQSDKGLEKWLKIITVITAVITLITTIIICFTSSKSCVKKPNPPDNKCKVTLEESQVRFKIDSELREGNLDSAINLLYCLEGHESAHTEESVRIVGWCINNDTDCDYLNKAQKIADEIRRTAIRSEQKEKISVERLKKGCLKKF